MTTKPQASDRYDDAESRLRDAVMRDSVIHAAESVRKTREGEEPVVDLEAMDALGHSLDALLACVRVRAVMEEGQHHRKGFCELCGDTCSVQAELDRLTEEAMR